MRLKYCSGGSGGGGYGCNVGIDDVFRGIHSFDYLHPSKSWKHIKVNLELYKNKPSVAGCIYYNKLLTSIKQIGNKTNFKINWRAYLSRHAIIQ
jgi:hypothetical protein